MIGRILEYVLNAVAVVLMIAIAADNVGKMAEKKRREG